MSKLDFALDLGQVAGIAHVFVFLNRDLGELAGRPGDLVSGPGFSCRQLLRTQLCPRRGGRRLSSRLFEVFDCRLLAVEVVDRFEACCPSSGAGCWKPCTYTLAPTKAIPTASAATASIRSLMQNMA